MTMGVQTSTGNAGGRLPLHRSADGHQREHALGLRAGQRQGRPRTHRQTHHVEPLQAQGINEGQGIIHQQR